VGLDAGSTAGSTPDRMELRAPVWSWAKATVEGLSLDPDDRRRWVGGAGSPSGPEDWIPPRPLLLAGVKDTPHRPPSAKARKGRRIAGKGSYGFRSRGA